MAKQGHQQAPTPVDGKDLVTKEYADATYASGGAADALTTVSGVVTISGSVAPTVGQALVADSPTTAVWQDVAAGSADALSTTSAAVTVSGSIPPTAGQALVAINPTTANWQDVSTSSYERQASFAVAPGSDTQEATLGRLSFSGSVIGLSVHTEDTRTAGEVVVNVKRNGTTTLSGTIDAGNVEYAVSSAAQGIHTAASPDEITIEVITQSYGNSLSAPTGMVVNVTMTDSTEMAGSPNVSLLDATQVYTGGQTIAQVTLTPATNVTVDMERSNNLEIELNQNVTLDNPINVAPGSTLVIPIRQNGTGGYTVTFGSAYGFPGGAPTITPGANAEDLICCYVRAAVSGTATTMLCSVAPDHIYNV
jgi:hypothetical protein